MSTTMLNGKLLYEEIVLKKEWMGHPKKARLTIIKNKADELINRGVAKLFVAKELKSPPKDKMFKRAPKTKKMN